jgi:hypothetical protein
MLTRESREWRVIPIIPEHDPIYEIVVKEKSKIQKQH